MKIISILLFGLSLGFKAKSQNAERLPFNAKPPMKISKLDDKAIGIKITFDSSGKVAQNRNVIDRKTDLPAEQVNKGSTYVLCNERAYAPRPLPIWDMENIDTKIPQQQTIRQLKHERAELLSSLFSARE